MKEIARSCANGPFRAAIVSAASMVALVIVLCGCAGPPALHHAVIGYDETTAHLDQQLLLLNIARAESDLPVHFTKTSSIAATFDWTTTVGVVRQLQDSPGTDFWSFNLGASASENPTFSIVPISGEEFTKRILTPFKENAFEFLVYQGARIDRVMRLLSNGVEVQKPDGSFIRFIENDPRRPQEYEEFRRMALHLAWLSANRQLFVRSLVFEETLIDDFKQVPRAEDIVNGFNMGLTWRQKPDGNYRLTRFRAGKVVVLNYDPLALTDQERFELNEKVKRNPAGFVYVEVRPGDPGGDFPIRGGIKLRSMVEIIMSIADGIHEGPEFPVEKDPRTGPVQDNPPVTLQINVTDTQPPNPVPSVKYGGKYYSVGDTPWDRTTFVILSFLFQTAVGDVEDVGIPITISK
jgi:hypothetical protein